MNIKLDEHGIPPTRAHGTDAGLDLFAPFDFVILAGRRVTIQIGVHVELPKNTVGYIRSKSGLMQRYGIIADGTIDEGYTGEIAVILFNLSHHDVKFKKGQKIAQLVVQPVLYPGMILVDELKETERGNDGFGSTGE